MPPTPGLPPLITFESAAFAAGGPGATILSHLAQAIARQWPGERIVYLRTTTDPAPPLPPSSSVMLATATSLQSSTSYLDATYVFATPGAYSLAGGAAGLEHFFPASNTTARVVRVRLASDPFTLGLTAPEDPSPGYLHAVVVDPETPAAQLPPSPEPDPVAYFDPTGDAGNLLKHRACRIALDSGQLAAGVIASSGGASLVDSFDRLARALTGRRVGVALAGGGALSYFHAAVLDELIQLGIPIDMVSGISGGALVGAYYCAGGAGPRGLGLFRERTWSFTKMVAKAIFSLDVVSRQVDDDLPGFDVRSLEVPLAAVTVNTSGDELAPRIRHISLGATAISIPELPDARAGYCRAGSLGLTVQLSGSAPGVWGVTELDVRASRPNTYVDGAAATQIPLEPLYLEGADLIACSYALPRIGQVSFPGPLQRASDGLDGLTAMGQLLSRWEGSLLAPRIPMAPIPPLRAFNHIAFATPAFWDGPRIYDEAMKQLHGDPPYSSTEPDSAPVGLAYLESLWAGRSAALPTMP